MWNRANKGASYDLDSFAELFVCLLALGAKKIATKSSQTAKSTTLTLFGFPVFARHLQDASFVNDPRRSGQQQPCQPLGTDNSKNVGGNRAANATAQTSAQDELAVDSFESKCVKISGLEGVC